MKNREYHSEDELLRKGEELISKSLFDIHGNLSQKKYPGKGGFGNKVEELHYQIENNNRQEPDVANLGIEIKTNSLKRLLNKAIVAKERVVLGMIDFSELVLEDFDTSSYLKKNRIILFNMYLYDKNLKDYDYRFLLVDIIKISKEDVDVIKRDWNIIKGKAQNLKAEEISQSDTEYLAAVTKGGKNQKPQPYQVGSKVGKAKRRAFAYKGPFINHLLQDYSLIKEDGKEYFVKNKKPKKYFKIMTSVHDGNIGKAVEEKFSSFIGLEDIKIADFFGYKDSFLKAIDKSRWHWNTSLILTGKRKKYLSNYIEEFSKSGLTVKTIRVSSDNTPKEEISFRTQDYILDEKSLWEESSLYEEFGRKFLWVIYKEKENNRFYLEKIFFWSMPDLDLIHVEKKWNELKAMFIKKDFRSSYFDNEDSFYFLKIKDRFGGQNKKHNEISVTSLSHWFRKNYVKKLIETN